MRQTRDGEKIPRALVFNDGHFNVRSGKTQEEGNQSNMYSILYVAFIPRKMLINKARRNLKSLHNPNHLHTKSQIPQGKEPSGHYHAANASKPRVLTKKTEPWKKRGVSYVT